MPKDELKIALGYEDITDEQDPDNSIRDRIEETARQMKNAIKALVP